MSNLASESLKRHSKNLDIFFCSHFIKGMSPVMEGEQACIHCVTEIILINENFVLQILEKLIQWNKVGRLVGRKIDRQIARQTGE